MSAKRTRENPALIPGTPSVPQLTQDLGISIHKGAARIEDLPFAAGDITCGVENELQAVVVGAPGCVDLPLTIGSSTFYENTKKRSQRGDVSSHVLEALEAWLKGPPEKIWENSWVRFPKACLCAYARHLLAQDLLEDKTKEKGPLRKDAPRFVVKEKGKEWGRIPVSYLIKLSLAQIIGTGTHLNPAIGATGKELLKHFSNDNTSPETFSFHPTPVHAGRNGARVIVHESLKRHLLTDLLIQYANDAFQLTANGQQAEVYFAPHPPLRQKKLNGLISDAFYRELFMSPCLSGWDRGEEKHRYMGLCHEVLSRSQLNAIKKLQECSIITRNLVVMPSTSNISLANNSTHISLGSRKLTRLLKDPRSGIAPLHEKWMGDLAIKITEHFLPLMVGTCTGAPYRLAFSDFHPETVLGFLPHELDYTHLRMIWRRWKKKAKNHLFGRPLTPFGPPWIDRATSRVFGLTGDLVPDFRLLDYPVALMSTDANPALDGTLGNQERLLDDLANLGAFDSRMAVYLPYRMRAQAHMGFSGFEGRHYSTFHHLGRDMGTAVRFQSLITALAFQYIAQGNLTHADIPDTPFVESERRHIFFAAAIGLPTLYIRADTPNRLIQEILGLTKERRSSRRYPGFIRVPLTRWQHALLEIIRRDAPTLIENHGAEDLMDDMGHMLDNPGDTAAGRLLSGITTHAGVRKPTSLSATDFNTAAEAYYRTALKQKHLTEAIDALRSDLSSLSNWASYRDPITACAVESLLKQLPPETFLTRRRDAILSGTLPWEELATLIRLILISVRVDKKRAEIMP